MNKIKLFPFFIFLAAILSCSTGPDMKVQSKPSLVKEGFISNNEYEIVCLGYPKEGLSGIQGEESAKRAALLNAYYFANDRFGELISPDRDGKTAKLTMHEGYCELIYIITKNNLKNLKKQADQKKELERKEKIEQEKEENKNE
ncbi:MAG: hypothetical protein FWG49_06150 [Leptospirales bacterium]|nr:hypothetical protein [Leptospirales bacterium]